MAIGLDSHARHGGGALGYPPRRRSTIVPAQFDDFLPQLVMPVQQLVCDLARWRLVGKFQRFRPEQLHADDSLACDGPERGATISELSSRAELGEVVGVAGEPHSVGIADSDLRPGR